MYKKILFLLSSIIVQFGSVQAQNYSIIPVDLNAQASPGDFFYAHLKVVNNSSSTIQMFITRVVKELPLNWTSCFCYPVCIAPFVDTLRFDIAPFSEDSIKPNFQSDLNPGMGTVAITLYEVGFEASVDTITFTGSTLGSTGMEPFLLTNTCLYPNPANDVLYLDRLNENDLWIKAFNTHGSLCWSAPLNNGAHYLDISGLVSGLYLFSIETKSLEHFYQKILIQH